MSQPKVDFTFGLQPIIHFVTRLSASLLKELVGASANEVRNIFDGTPAGVGPIMHSFEFTLCGPSVRIHIDLFVLWSIV